MYSHVLVDEVLEGASRSRGHVPRSDAVRAARSVGGERPSLRVPVGEAVLESIGLRGHALGQGLWVAVSVSEIVEGVPLNAACPLSYCWSRGRVEARRVGRCRLVALHVWRDVMHATEHGAGG